MGSSTCWTAVWLWNSRTAWLPGGWQALGIGQSTATARSLLLFSAIVLCA